MKPDCEHWSDCGAAGGGCCAITKFGARPSFGVCRVCLGGIPFVQVITTPDKVVPRERWGFAVRAVAKLAQPADKGLGDTLTRVLGAVGGDVYKRWFKKLTGKDCGCADRATKLNSMYPYQG